jgi:hypothetical protein
MPKPNRPGYSILNVHITKELNEQLRVAAFRERSTKSALIREGVEMVLKQWAARGRTAEGETRCVDQHL